MTSDTRAILFGLGAVGCWSTVASAFKIALEHLDTQQLLFFATVTASLVLTVNVIVRHGVTALTMALGAHWRLTLLAGLLNPVLYYELLFRAYDVLPAQVAMPINYTWAIVLTLMAVVFLKQKILAMDIIAALICYLGVVIIATQGRFSLVGGGDLFGVALAILSTVIWAGYWILNVRDRRGPAVGLCMNFLVALPLTAVNCYVFSSFSVPVKGMLAAGYVGLVEMAAGFMLWSMALKLASNAARVSNLIFLSPLLSLVFIHLVLGEAILPTTLVGLVLILGGLMSQQYAHRRALEKTR